MICRAFRYRLYPTAEQEEALGQFVGVTRFIYNLALEQRRDFWRQARRHGIHLNYASQGREVTQLRSEVDWIRAAPSSALTQALRDLDRAYAAFFAGRARFPTPRRKGQNDAFRIQAKPSEVKPLNSRWGAVRVPNLGWVKFRASRHVRGDVKNATVSLVAGNWFVSLVCEIEHDIPANDNPSVGIDRGIAIPLALSNGETFHLPEALVGLDWRKRKAQRALARCKRGSKRRLKRLRRVAKLSARIARVRSDWQHRVSTHIADRFGVVALEDLKIPSMTRSGTGKRGLNRSILNQGWGTFATKLAYKLEERGGSLHLVNPAYTSQTCSECGVVDAQSRKSQSAFVCTSCGFTENADRNAAIVILRRSTPPMLAEGSGCAPVETRTSLEAA